MTTKSRAVLMFRRVLQCLPSTTTSENTAARARDVPPETVAGSAGEQLRDKQELVAESHSALRLNERLRNLESAASSSPPPADEHIQQRLSELEKAVARLAELLSSTEEDWIPFL